MGVTGLWTILDPVGHPIKLDGLEGKRLGVDANVWLYKFIRGFRDKDNNSSSLDAHKLGLFNRISKLLFYRIRPVFVFDGPAPILKRRTLEKRQNIRNKQLEKVQETALALLAKQLKEQYPDANINNIRIQMPELKSHNLAAAEKLTDEDRELFYLPPESISVSSDSDDCDSSVPQLKQENTVYLIDSEDELFVQSSQYQSSVDIHSKDFNSLPPEIRYEMLTDIKEEKKKICRSGLLPEDADSSSKLQLERLKERRMVQEKIEQCEKEICSNYTGECDGQSIRSYRVQSDSTSTMLYYTNPKIKSADELNNIQGVIPESKSHDPSAPEQIQSNPTSRVEFSNQDRMTLRDVRSASDRNTNKVTSKIIEEAKELLRLFGVPYIEAPGEAEAQCALLEKLELTEGTITDDSDVWLFGAQNVYRHFFSDDKYVMHYKMADIEHHVSMTRENLVCFAMLVGSDYTDGIMNVGPVTALEILSEFRGDKLDPLMKFKNWKLKYEATKGCVPSSRAREKFLKFKLNDEFPSRTVFEGYMQPSADTSTEQFAWGTPELDELREYARRHFGWDPKKADEKLLPVMKKLSERKTQPTIDSFFFKTAVSQNPELFRSKRVNQALGKIAKTAAVVERDEVNLTEDEDEDTPTTSARAAKRTVRKESAGAVKKRAARAKKKSPKRKDTDESDKRHRVKRAR